MTEKVVHGYFHCQSLRKHVSDLSDPVIDSSNVLFLSETRSNDGENVDIPNFNCNAKSKRKNEISRSGNLQKSLCLEYSNFEHGHFITVYCEIDIVNHQLGIYVLLTVFWTIGTNIRMVVVYISP
ncbi:ATP-dependent DNA helicase [Trichonephila clavata]|uniref:ATP-dependent DNA helicase n=1 Tax=Trichonephila clavata TaxID=2740835 RepID=A0A8X6G8G6_TRICU|nr:ATP-dependent DNA helicase [Trichonephila clavata]